MVRIFRDLTCGSEQSKAGAAELELMGLKMSAVSPQKSQFWGVYRARGSVESCELHLRTPPKARGRVQGECIAPAEVPAH